MGALIPILEEFDPEAPEEETEADDVAQARMSLTRSQAAAFINRSRQLMESGRPPCTLCERPLDPAGHTCPATNGHTPRLN